MGDTSSRELNLSGLSSEIPSELVSSLRITVNHQADLIGQSSPQLDRDIVVDQIATDSVMLQQALVRLFKSDREIRKDPYCEKSLSAIASVCGIDKKLLYEHFNTDLRKKALALINLQRPARYEMKRAHIDSGFGKDVAKAKLLTAGVALFQAVGASPLAQYFSVIGAGSLGALAPIVSYGAIWSLFALVGAGEAQLIDSVVSTKDRNSKWHKTMVVALLAIFQFGISSLVMSSSKILPEGELIDKFQKEKVEYAQNTLTNRSNKLTEVTLPIAEKNLADAKLKLKEAQERYNTQESANPRDRESFFSASRVLDGFKSEDGRINDPGAKARYKVANDEYSLLKEQSESKLKKALQVLNEKGTREFLETYGEQVWGLSWKKIKEELSDYNKISPVDRIILHDRMYDLEKQKRQPTSNPLEFSTRLFNDLFKTNDAILLLSVLIGDGMVYATLMLLMTNKVYTRNYGNLDWQNTARTFASSVANNIVSLTLSQADQINGSTPTTYIPTISSGFGSQDNAQGVVDLSPNEMSVSRLVEIFAPPVSAIRTYSNVGGISTLSNLNLSAGSIEFEHDQIRAEKDSLIEKRDSKRMREEILNFNASIQHSVTLDEVYLRIRDFIGLRVDFDETNYDILAKLSEIIKSGTSTETEYKSSEESFYAGLYDIHGMVLDLQTKSISQGNEPKIVHLFKVMVSKLVTQLDSVQPDEGFTFDPEACLDSESVGILRSLKTLPLRPLTVEELAEKHKQFMNRSNQALKSLEQLQSQYEKYCLAKTKSNLTPKTIQQYAQSMGASYLLE